MLRGQPHLATEATVANTSVDCEVSFERAAGRWTCSGELLVLRASNDVALMKWTQLRVS